MTTTKVACGCIRLWVNFHPCTDVMKTRGRLRNMKAEKKHLIRMQECSQSGLINHVKRFGALIDARRGTGRCSKLAVDSRRGARETKKALQGHGEIDRSASYACQCRIPGGVSKRECGLK